MLRTKFKTLWIPFLTLSLAPGLAHGLEARPGTEGAPEGGKALPAAKRAADLTAAELSGAFLNFEAVKEGQDPSSRVRLFGMVFEDCLPKFQFSNSKLDPRLRDDKSVIGFRISDAGGEGRDCMARHREANDVCSEETRCRALSQLPQTSMDLTSEGDVKVQLIRIDPNQDRKKIQAEDFESPITHVSAARIRELRAAEAKRRQDARIATLRSQVNTCRKSETDRDTARTAGDSLVELGLMTEEARARLEKDLLAIELRSIALDLQKAPLNNPEAINEAVERLKAFESAHPESADAIAVQMYQKALAYAKAAKSPEAYDQASTIVAEAQSLGGLSDLNSTRLQNYQRDITVGRFQFVARQGISDPWSFWQPYQDFMMSLQGEMQGCSGPNMASESCRSTMQAYRAASTIPQTAQQAQYEQYMFAMRMQQQMAQLNMNGMGGAPGAGTQGSGFYK